MHVHGLGTSCLTLIACAVIGLSQHHGEVAHCRPPFLSYCISLGREREGVLSVCVGKSLGKVGNGIVERQTAHRQLRFLGLLLLVLGSSLPGSPLLFLLLVHLVHCLHFLRPLLDNGVDAALA